MSLAVSPGLLAQAGAGEVNDGEFAACVRVSLPYAWSVVSRLADELHAGDSDFADNQIPPPDEGARGQLLRALASDAIRGAMERHFGVRLAFQNCHRVAVFSPAAEAVRLEFVTPREQILNQVPELVNC